MSINKAKFFLNDILLEYESNILIFKVFFVLCSMSPLFVFEGTLTVTHAKCLYYLLSFLLEADR